VKNKEAIAAKAECDKALKDAQDAYIKAQQAAYTKYITALDKARMDAYKTDNVAEVEALSKEKYRVQEEQKSLEPQNAVNVKSITGKVPANQKWTKVMEVKKGQILEITATGEWKSWGSKEIVKPDGVSGIIGNFRGGSLIGKLGEKGEEFYVGKGAALVVKADDTLFLGNNNITVGNCSGELQVTVTVLATRR